MIPHGERELIVRFSPNAATSLREGAVTALTSYLEALFEAHDARLVPLASVSALPNYFRVLAQDTELDTLATVLLTRQEVTAAYVKPAAIPAVYLDELEARRNDPPKTPDYTPRQHYLDAAPVGVDARHAWNFPGGRGTGIRAIDIEGAWRFTHEDLAKNKGGVVGGTPVNDVHWRNHGTAVLGVFAGDQNAYGVTGICPDIHASAVSIFGGTGTAGAIVVAADRLRPGDLLLIELHRGGPNSDGRSQKGFIPIEWWPDDFDAIQYATSKGVLVVEAGGNGSENLDAPIYDRPARGFPRDWKNPFRRGDRDSGAILVGAGAPPQGTHGRNHGPDRSRLDFSNWGAAIDVQGWGREVTTCGYGDLQGGKEEDIWYTDQFSGTSSASPVIVGTLGSLQGILGARKAPLLTPARARSLLRETGSPQTGTKERPESQRIGKRPDLKAALQWLQIPPPVAEAPMAGESDASGALWRVAAKQLLSKTRAPVSALLSRRGGKEDSEAKTKIAAYLETEQGTALLALGLSVGISLVGPAGTTTERLAKELRQRALADASDSLIALVMQAMQGVLPLLQAGVLSQPPRLPEPDSKQE